MSKFWGLALLLILYLHSIFKYLGDEKKPMDSADAFSNVMAALVSRSVNIWVVYFLFKLLNIIK